MLPHHQVDGPPGAPLVVLGNSLGTTGDMWAPQMPSLLQRFRVVRYEHRGHGGTTAPPGPFSIADLGGDLVELLDHLGEQRASLCGLSLGGMVAMWVAAHHPARVDRLVLACTAAHLPPASAWDERAAVVRGSAVVPGAGMVRDAGTGVVLDTVIARYFTAGFLSRRPDARASVAVMLAAAEPEGYAGCCEAIGAMDLRPDLERIAAPTLVIAGALDPVVTPPMAVDLAQAITGAGLLVIPSAAHLANIEQPEAFTTAAVDHLAGTAGERGRRTRRAVLGDAHVERSAAAATPFTEPFVDLITRYAWGEIWTRPGLDGATRSCITLAMLVALGRFDELDLHVRGAVRNGLSHDQIGEVLLQTAVYCGVPAANTAFAVARRALEEPEG